MIYRMLTTALFPLVTGCAGMTASVAPDVPLIAPKTAVVIPQGLIADCPPLTLLTEGKSYTQGDALDAINIWKGQYDDCAVRFKKYVDLTGKALNINEVPMPKDDTASK